MNREQAIELAQQCAKEQPQSYYGEPFQPHEWVISAIVRASGVTRCQANRTADPPQDCDAPFCGCNPAWTQCMEWLDECGWTANGQELRRLLLEAENLAALGDIDENTEAYGWGLWMQQTRRVLGIVSDTPLRKLPENTLEVGLTPDGCNVVLNHPTMLTDPNGIGGHIIFSPDQAYELALTLVNRAQECK